MIGPYTEVVDRQVQEALDGELERQRTTIELIASENFASPAVLAAQGSVLTNKYARATPASATTAAASTWTRPSSSP